MESRTKFLIFSYSIFILFTLIPAQSQNTCKPDSCSSHPYHGPLIRFPFRLKHRQAARCGYPGFDLHCNTRNQTILHLPQAGEFIVDYIDYARQALFIVDPDSCLPNRALNFSLSGSPFRASRFTKFTFYNCTGSWPEYASLSDDYEPLFCFGESNSIVLASSPVAKAPLRRCRMMANVSVPPRWRYPADQGDWSFTEEFELVWYEPHCEDCEDRAGDCGLIGDSGLLIGCSNSKSSRRGVPRSGKYAIIVGVGIPGLLCIIGLACYICRLIKTKLQQDRPNPTTTVFHQESINGLDLPTIESYPKTLLGRSCRLPRASDSTCHICLSEYQPKETLRSIPECNHYFHVACIDQWLKLNATCPVCRTLPHPSSIPLSSSLIQHQIIFFCNFCV